MRERKKRQSKEERRSFKQRRFISIAVINCALWLADCCCVLCCLWQGWSHGFSGSKRRARWITPSWPLTQGRTNWSSVPGKSLVCLSLCLVSVLLSSTTPTLGPAFVDQPFIAIFITFFWSTVSGMINIFFPQRKIYTKLWVFLSTEPVFSAAYKHAHALHATLLLIACTSIQRGSLCCQHEITGMHKKKQQLRQSREFTNALQEPRWKKAN